MHTFFYKCVCRTINCVDFMKYSIKIRQNTIHRTNDLKQSLKTISSLFKKGHTEVYLCGGRLGTWW